MPERIQLKRTAGWRLPEGAVNVARHSSGKSKWGNPFRVGSKVKSPGRWGTESEPYNGKEPPGRHEVLDGRRGDWEVRIVRDRADAVALYVAYYSVTWDDSHRERIRRELGGKTLACWCPPGEPCHGDQLLRVAAGWRMSTPDVREPGGGTRIAVQRCCNGCGERIGDVTAAEIECAISGDPLPDVRSECPRCAPELETADAR